jgi:transposase
MGNEKAAELEMRNEPVNDVPVLLHVIKERLGLMSALDKLVRRHGNRRGLSIGGVMGTWLAHILSECNHFMSHVENWAERLPETLGMLMEEPVNGADLDDARLSEVIRVLSNDATWHAMEHETNQAMIRAYKLKVECVRLDTTTASVYSDNEGAVLFKRGYSKDHRPDLRQLKVMVAGLDPLGAIVGADVVSGDQADDKLYVPMIERMRKSLGERGILYVGDSKMSALKTRSHIQATGNTYLMPLARIGEVPEQLSGWIEAALQGQAKLVKLLSEEEPDEEIGRGYELKRKVVCGEDSWTERVLIVQSEAFAEAARKGLGERIARASQALETLTPPPAKGKHPFSDRQKLSAAAQAIVKKHAVEAYLSWEIEMKNINPKKIRAYRNQPARVEYERWLVLRVLTDKTAIDRDERYLGWRAYVTNAPTHTLDLQRAVLTYRDEWLIERDLGRLKGRVLSLAPLWLKREDHALGMTRLLTLAVRILALVEHEARLKIKNDGQAVSGLFLSRKNRVTELPTTERMLGALDFIVLTTMRTGGTVQRFITTLTETQQRVIYLVGCPPDLYQRLTRNLAFG